MTSYQAAEPSDPSQREEPSRSDVETVAAELADLATAPLTDHIAVYERLHARLQASLSAIDA